MKQLKLEDLSQHFLFELENNYGVSPDEELKQVYLLENREFIVITESRAIFNTSGLHQTRNLIQPLPIEIELNKLGNLQVEFEEIEETTFSIN